jgi:hypothetical protein
VRSLSSILKNYLFEFFNTIKLLLVVLKLSKLVHNLFKSLLKCRNDIEIIKLASKEFRHFLNLTIQTCLLSMHFSPWLISSETRSQSLPTTFSTHVNDTCPTAIYWKSNLNQLHVPLTNILLMNHTKYSLYFLMKT